MIPRGKAPIFEEGSDISRREAHKAKKLLMQYYEQVRQKALHVKPTTFDYPTVILFGSVPEHEALQPVVLAHGVVSDMAHDLKDIFDSLYT